jgi:hypothetical protein
LGENKSANEGTLEPASVSRNEETEAAVMALAKSTRLGREMRKHAVFFNPVAPETMSTQPIIVEDESGEEIVEEINFCFDAIYLGIMIRDESDYEVPIGINDALKVVTL